MAKAWGNISEQFRQNFYTSRMLTAIRFTTDQTLRYSNRIEPKQITTELKIRYSYAC